MKVLVGALKNLELFNQEKALVGAFSVIVLHRLIVYSTSHHADTLHCTLSILSLLQHFQSESLVSSWLLRLLLSASTQCLTSTRAALHVLISTVVVKCTF